MTNERNTKSITLIGVPTESGTHRVGCRLGPDALRAAGLTDMLARQGHKVTDSGNLKVPHQYQQTTTLDGRADQVIAWAQATQSAMKRAFRRGTVPLLLGGDHSLSVGSIAAAAHRADELNRPLFVLWLDAHPDLHSLQTTQSGNLHGTPLAHALGLENYAGRSALGRRAVPPEQICLVGARDIDAAERTVLAAQPIQRLDLAEIAAHGVTASLRPFLDRVTHRNGMLHVSLDTDFLSPQLAPAVGTPVAGGADIGVATAVMDTLARHDRVTSLDIVELNPFLDLRSRTATLLLNLTARLFAGADSGPPPNSRAAEHQQVPQRPYIGECR